MDLTSLRILEGRIGIRKLWNLWQEYTLGDKGEHRKLHG